MEERKVLITGGAGFFGGILKRHLLDKGLQVVSLDIVEDGFAHSNYESRIGDVRNARVLEGLMKGRDFAAVYHLAAVLAHAVKDKGELWSSNVEGTQAVAKAAAKAGVAKVIFTSSNCLWGKPLGRPVTEVDTPEPVEIYGQSKWAGEKALFGYAPREDETAFATVAIRCPTIIDEGRLGLLAILFEFIEEGRKVWTVGGGANRYQFIYGQDLAEACWLALEKPVAGVFNIGSDDVHSLREVFQYVIREAGSRSRVASLPRDLALPAMRVAHRLGVSPLGPYQYKMIAEDFCFDTSKIKRELGWAPTLSNEQMLAKAYAYYAANRDEIRARRGQSAHRSAAPMGAIRLLKWMS